MRRAMGWTVAMVGACQGTPEASNNPDCGHDRLAQIPAGDTAPDQPDGQEGAVEDAVIGVWQHTWTVAGDDGTPEPISDGDADLRFAFPDASTFVYCQQTNILGPDVLVQSSPMSIEDNRLSNAFIGYTALTWSSDVLVMRNELFADRDERFILERLE